MEDSERAACDEVSASDDAFSLKNWKIVLDNRQFAMLLGNSRIAITKILFDVNEKTKDASIKVSKPSKLPDAMDELFKETYQLLSISKKNLNDSDVKSATLKFRVDKTWFDNKRVSPKEIVLARYRNGWKNLETEHVGFDGAYHYYDAVADGFSYFAITARDSNYDQKKPEADADKGDADKGKSADKVSEKSADEDYNSDLIGAKVSKKADKKEKDAKTKKDDKKKVEEHIDDSDEESKPRSGLKLILAFLLIFLILLLLVFYSRPYFNNKGDETGNNETATNKTENIAALKNLTPAPVAITVSGSDAVLNQTQESAGANLSARINDFFYGIRTALDSAFTSMFNRTGANNSSVSEAYSELTDNKKVQENLTPELKGGLIDPSKNILNLSVPITEDFEDNESEEIDAIQLRVMDTIGYVYDNNLENSLRYQVWSMNNNKVVNLNGYVVDEDGDKLNFSISKIQNINSEIKDSNLILTPDMGWYGIRDAQLVADDGRNGKLNINMTLVVSKDPIAQKEMPSFFVKLKNFIVTNYLYLIAILILLILLFILMKKFGGQDEEDDDDEEDDEDNADAESDDDSDHGKVRSISKKSSKRPRLRVADARMANNRKKFQRTKVSVKKKRR
ncbi:MAG: PGF-pre-PGF domain-containing protein [Nanoarchaeota archaeon]|nr:PGF-pre-PGF domain-containing protein [Nanoarchaeota archaeon]